MATRAGAGQQQPIGSADWIHKELGEISTLCENELEDFTFSSRNEMEWLNEHMHDIFSSNKLQLSELLKTPGKLRGKTPRTARQRSPLKDIVRQPLGEISSIDKRYNSPLRTNPTASPLVLKAKNEARALAVVKSPAPVADTQATHDSGYHGDTQDVTELTMPIPESQDLEVLENNTPVRESLQRTPAEYKSAVAPRRDAARSTEGSFHSANESQPAKTVPVTEKKSTGINIDDVESGKKASEQLRRESAEQVKQRVDTQTEEALDQDDTKEEDDEQNDAASENSTPAKPPVRKSSLNFASLPAREPLATKKSMGNIRASQHATYYGRITGGKSLGAVRADESDDELADEDQENSQPLVAQEDPDSEPPLKPLQSKSSTQRLADRINALGKMPASRPTKSIAASAAQPAYPALPEAKESAKAEPERMLEAKAGEQGQQEDEDGDSIMHDDEESPSSPNYEVFPSSDDELEQPVNRPAQTKKQSPTVSEQRAPSPEARISTTPAGSPPKPVAAATVQNGPIQASKSRLQTIMQSARGLFTSAATASAEARLEASSMTSPKREKPEPGYPQLPEASKERLASKNGKSASPEEDERQNTNTKDANAKNTATMELDEDGESKALPEHDDDQDADELSSRPAGAMEPPPRPRTALSKPNTGRRPVARSAKEQPAQQKVSIKMGTLAGRRPLTATALSGAKDGEQSMLKSVASKESISSQSTAASSNSLKSSMASKSKALLAAERKRENEERMAQKKAEQKRELEKKRSAQQEEAQKREQARQAAERQKERERQAAEEKKRQEQRQAVEKKRAEAQAKREQMQKDHQALKSSAYRPEPPRPASRQAMVNDFPKPPSSTKGGSKLAPKRVWNPDQEDDSNARPAHQQPGQSYQQSQDGGKRRKTQDEEELGKPATTVRPTMAPPMRMSNIKNTLSKSIFGSNYPRAPPPAAHHAGAAQQQQQQQQQQHAQSQLPPRPPTALDNSRFQNGQIPFANGNPHGQQQAATASSTTTSNPFKTPMQPSRFGQAGGADQQAQQAAQQQQQQQQQLKSSPFINGEYVHLEEIPTDSEEEDSDSEAEAARKAEVPDWVRTPNLNETLMRQETVNPDAVFGPIAPLNMEEMFRNGKGGAAALRKDFRARTSSANWAGADRLTEDEIRHDLAAREKMRQDGGWTFGL